MIDFQNKNMMFSFFAVLIPIIIHFLIRKKSKQIAFPSIFFLKETINKKYKKVKFHQLLLLIIRTLIIFFLCVSFIEPTIKVPAFLASNLSYSGNYAIIIDTSLSMRLKSDNISIFNEMKNKMLDFIENLPYGSRITVYQTSNNGIIVNQPLSLYSNKLLNDLNLSIECGYDSSNLLQVYKRAENLLSKTNTKDNSIAIFSDFQMNETNELKMYLDSNVKYPTILIFPEDDSRFSIKNLYIKNSNIPFISYLNRETIPLEIEISGISENHVKGLYSISINNNLKNEDSFSSSENNSFLKTILTERHENKTTLVECKINGDDFSDDNIHFAVFKGPPLINILSTESLSLNSNNYINRALNPFQDINIEGKTPFIISKTSSLKNKSELFRHDVILISDPLFLSIEGIENLKDFIYKGGNAIISFNQLESIEKYNKILFNGINNKNFLPKRIEKIEQSSKDKGMQIYLSEESKKYFHYIEESQYWQFCFVNKTLNFKTPPNNSRVILETDDKTPLCILNSYGNGQIVFFMTSLTPQTLTMLSEPVFIPFMHNLLNLLTQKSRKRIYTEIGSKYYLNDSFNKDDIIYSPSGKKLSPQKDALNNYFILPESPGIYNILKAKSNLIKDSFAANPPYKESILKYTKLDDIKAIKNNKIFTSKKIKETTNFINRQKASFALWRILFWLIILLLIIEIIIINKLKP